MNPSLLFLSALGALLLSSCSSSSSSNALRTNDGVPIHAPTGDGYSARPAPC